MKRGCLFRETEDQSLVRIAQAGFETDLHESPTPCMFLPLYPPASSARLKNDTTQPPSSFLLVGFALVHLPMQSQP